MKKYLRAAGLSLMVVMSLQANAQLKRANRKFEHKEYAVAIPLYHRHLKKAPASTQAIELLAHSYRLVNDSKNAEYWYDRLSKTENKEPINTFYYAQALVQNEKWDAAIPLLEQYLQVKDYDEVAQSLLATALNYRIYVADSARYVVKPSNINTAKVEFSPTLHDSIFVFASSRTPTKSIFNWTRDNFLDLYQAKFDGKAELGKPVMLPGMVNSKYHEGGSTFSPEGNVMYFTRNSFNKGKLNRGKKGLVRLKTYRAELVNNKWDNITEVSFNGEEYSVGHPCLNPEGNILYFVSDKKGGLGGTDIYKVRRQGEGWGDPENMGPRINTHANEMFPWVSTTGLFYFASNGHPGMGGLDLFRVTSLGSEFEKVSNMGYPINSSKDDFALVIDEKSGVGFFSSNRKGGKGDDDIYSFTQRQILEGIVLDRNSGYPVRDVKVEIFGPNGLATVVRTDAAGRFRYGLDRNTEYLLVATSYPYMESRERVSTVSFDPAVPVEFIIKLNREESIPEQPIALDTVKPAPIPEEIMRIEPVPVDTVKPAPIPEEPIHLEPIPVDTVKPAPVPEEPIRLEPIPVDTIKPVPAPEETMRMTPSPQDSVKPVVEPVKNETPSPEKSMIEELRKEGRMLQDFDAPKDSVAKPNPQPEKGGEDGKPK